MFRPRPQIPSCFLWVVVSTCQFSFHLCHVFWFCPMRAPPGGHSEIWVDGFSKSLICLLGLDSSTTVFRMSPEIPWVTVLSSSLCYIPVLLSSLGLPFLVSHAIAVCLWLSGRTERKQKSSGI